MSMVFFAVCDARGKEFLNLPLVSFFLILAEAAGSGVVAPLPTGLHDSIITWATLLSSVTRS